MPVGDALHAETLRAPASISKRTIRILDEGGSGKTQEQRLLFPVAKGWIKSTCARRHIKEIHKSMSNTANFIDNWL